MENVKFCEASPKQVKLAWQIGLGTGFGMYVVLKTLGFILLRRHIPMQISYRCHARLARLLPGFTLVGAVAFLADALKERHSLVTCDPWSGLQWVAFLVHLCFLVRLVINFGVTYRPQLMATVVDVWLFVQACFALGRGLNMYAFTFLTLVRFFHSECLMAWNRLSTVARTGSAMVLATLVVAGALQVAEEHDSLYGTHGTAQGTLQPIRSFWIYVYWTVVTLSTVGYGEITPSTNTSKVVTGIAVVGGVLWYGAVNGRITVAMKEYFREVRYPPPESSRPRIIVLNRSDANNLTHLLKAVKKEDDNDLEVIVLVPSNLMTPDHLRLTSLTLMDTLLSIKVLPCTNLQQDLTSLLPYTDNKQHNYARQRDTVVVFCDPEAKDPEMEDARVVHLLVQARAYVPDTPFIVQVILSRSRRAVQQTPCWSLQDVVVCMQELTVDLLAQAAVCSAAGPIMSTLLKAPTVSPEKVNDLFQVGNIGKMPQICYYESNESDLEDNNFIENALVLYEKEGDLLLGWFSPEIQNFTFLREHDQPPPDAKWVVISANTQLVPKSVQSSDTLSGVSFGYTDEPLVAVWGEEPGRIDLEEALLKFPEVRLFSKEEWKSVSTVVMTTVGMPPSLVVKAHCQRDMVMQLSENPSMRFVTDMHPGQGQKALDQRTTSHVVNKCMVMWATAAAIVNPEMYHVWRQLAASNSVVTRMVKVNCSYKIIFRDLVRDRMLPVGVRKVYEDDCYITNPPAMLQMTPGDLVMCFQINPAAHNSLPSITLPQGTGRATQSSTYYD